jgi:hypothetical protein
MYVLMLRCRCAGTPAPETAPEPSGRVAVSSPVKKAGAELVTDRCFADPGLDRKASITNIAQLQVQFLKNRSAGAYDRTREDGKRRHQRPFKDKTLAGLARRDDHGTSTFAQECSVHQ